MVNRGFFKRYTPSLGEENKKIPLQGTWPTYIKLRDRYNNFWRVKVETVEGSSYFLDGWTKFVEDNRIADGDVLIFEYSSQGLLDIKILGSNGCLAKGVGQYRPIINSEGDNAIEGDDIVFEEVDEDSADEEGLRDSTLGILVDDDGTEVEDDIGCASRSEPKRRKHFDWIGEEIFQSGVVLRPKNPYFVTKIAKYTPSHLYIPTTLIDIHQLQLPEKLMLFDSDERKFPAIRRIWKNGKTLYNRGWGPLCRANRVGEEDTCIFEFERRDGDLCIHVSMSAQSYARMNNSSKCIFVMKDLKFISFSLHF